MPKCIRCESETVIKESNGALSCLACGNDQQDILERNRNIVLYYREYGQTKTCKRYTISTRTLYKIPGIQQEKAKRMLRRLPQSVLNEVLSEYLPGNVKEKA